MVMVHMVCLPLHTYKQVVSDSNQSLIRALRFVSKQCVGHLSFVKFFCWFIPVVWFDKIVILNKSVLHFQIKHFLTHINFVNHKVTVIIN